MNTRGLCKAHIVQVERGQDLRPTLDMLPRHCRHEGCERPIFRLRLQVCYYHWASEYKPPRVIAPRDCLNCGKEFTPKQRSNAQCCSPECGVENARLKATYSLTGAQVRKLVAQQDHKCAICRKPFANRGNIDHDHACCPGEKSCGKCIRGVLCKKCNTAIGMLDDDPDRCFMAAAYLQR